MVACSIAAVCACGAFAQGMATGVVYDDANRNGVRDAGENGIASVCVSNGREVVQTDASGAWTLPVDDDTIFFAIKPSQWMTPVNAEQVAQSFYIHKPNGSPELEAKGVAPTGPLPSSIDFPLYARPESAQFKMLLFGDPQARGVREVNFVTHDVVEECIGTDAAFGISLGDIVADDPNLFREINESIAQIGIPWYNTFGNHDYNRGSGSDEMSDETFERFYGPGSYAFEYGQVCFLIMDDVYFKPDGKYEGRFTDDQLAFVQNYLALVPEEKLVVMTMHIPIVACKNRDAMFAILAKHPHTFSISAHTHTQFNVFAGAEQGWPGAEPHHHLVQATVCGSWWCGTFDELGIPHATMNDGAPNGYSVVSFDGNKYSVAFKAARRPADYQMNIYLPDEVAQADAGATEILVNVFAGSERSIVEMQLGKDGAWTRLEQTKTIDPECLRMHKQNEFLNEEVFGWKMDYPSETTHMWKGVLPANPAVGTHTVTVRTTDMYGQTWEGKRIVRVR
ncbi:MAG: calcineurin-like phosphoesterase C-terminal domain-containing protein [Candidatus Hydrogenedentes bacterium]|nr:calcineurin-like phosphoesterase C-terminal domain-containing protein [Candidatus Hydrogenedentota bacterium]